MEEAGGESAGGMLALLGDGEAAREAASAAGTILANDNGPTQIVVAGPRAALEATGREAKARGVAVDATRGQRGLPLAGDASPRCGRFALRSSGSSCKPASAPVFSSATARAVRARAGRGPRRPRRRDHPAGALARDAGRAAPPRRPPLRRGGPGQGAHRARPAKLRRRRGHHPRRGRAGACLRPCPTEPAAAARGRCPAPAPRGGDRRGSASPCPRPWSRTRRSPPGSASSEDWIVARTGVRERRVAAAGETVADLGAAAAARALAAARVDARTRRPRPRRDDEPRRADPERRGRWSPSGSAPSGAGAIDLNAACSGFVSALALAAGPDRVRAGAARCSSSAPT